MHICFYRQHLLLFHIKESLHNNLYSDIINCVCFTVSLIIIINFNNLLEPKGDDYHRQEITQHRSGLN